MHRTVEGARLFQGRESAQPARDPTAQTVGVLRDEDAVEADRGVDQTETPMKVAQGAADVEKTLAEMMAGLCVISVVTSYRPELIHGNAPSFEDQMQAIIRSRSHEHVYDADNMRTTIAALLQCEDLPD
jgi:hypothetical protein